jgi:hypothetical protein
LKTAWNDKASNIAECSNILVNIDLMASIFLMKYDRNENGAITGLALASSFHSNNSKSNISLNSCF